MPTDHDDEDRSVQATRAGLDEKNATPDTPAPIILFARLKGWAAIVASPP
jgi:hypothetical protein